MSAPENAVIQPMTKYEEKHGLEMMKITAPGYGVRLEAWGLNYFSFYWPVALREHEVPELICSIGKQLGANSYACDGNGRTWITSPDASPEDIDTEKFHTSLLGKIMIRGCYEGFATKNSDGSCVVEWTKAFNDGDFAVDQMSVSIRYLSVALTDEWLRKLIRSTCTKVVKDNVDTLTAAFYDSYINEGLVLTLRSMKFPID